MVAETSVPPEPCDYILCQVDQHLKLSFSHIMKHWKKTNMVTKPGQQQRTVLLRSVHCSRLY